VTSKRFGIRKIELVECSLLGEGGTILLFATALPPSSLAQVRIPLPTRQLSGLIKLLDVQKV
jgi:hypothetical protein